jgi:membrane protein DedA with SNARE-associated domain
MSRFFADLLKTIVPFVVGLLFVSYLFHDEDWRVLGEPWVLTILAMTVFLSVVLAVWRRWRRAVGATHNDSSRLIP